MHAYPSHLLFLLGTASASITVFSLLICIGLAFKIGRTTSRSNAVSAQILEEISVLKREIAGTTVRADEQSRRLARLESRARRGPGQPEPDELDVASMAQLSITERRHRILSLARRGLDVNTIATMLGEMNGEIELIINMGHSGRETEAD